MLGGQRTLIIGEYLPTSTLEHLLDLKEALNGFPGKYLIVIGDLNTNIGNLQKPRRQQVADFLAYFGLVNLISHLRQQMHFLHLKMWCQVQQGRLLWSRCDYVFGSYRRIFDTMWIKDLRYFGYDHFALCARILHIPARCHGGYLRGHHSFPLTLLPTGPLNLVDTKFQDLKSLDTLLCHMAVHKDPIGCHRGCSGWLTSAPPSANKRNITGTQPVPWWGRYRSHSLWNPDADRRWRQRILTPV